MSRRLSAVSAQNVRELAKLGLIETDDDAIEEYASRRYEEVSSEKIHVKPYDAKLPPEQWLDEGIPAAPAVLPHQQDSWKKKAFLTTQIGSRVDEIHRGAVPERGNGARGERKRKQALALLPVSYIGGGWWSLYCTKWCRHYYHFAGYPKKTTWTAPPALRRMKRMFKAVVDEDIAFLEELMKEKVDILGFMNSTGLTAVETAIKNRCARVIHFFRSHDITDSRLRKRRGGRTATSAKNLDLSFGKFGKFQERYMFHNNAQRLFNMAMEPGKNYTRSTTSLGPPRSSVFIP